MGGPRGSLDKNRTIVRLADYSDPPGLTPQKHRRQPDDRLAGYTPR